MQQESIRTKKNSNKLKEYQNQMYQLTQDIREQGYIQNAKKTLFADAFNTTVNNNIEVLIIIFEFSLNFKQVI